MSTFSFPFDLSSIVGFVRLFYETNVFEKGPFRGTFTFDTI